ncbi:sphinganine-1-phosphate aldolase [Aureococcus anophagefferens]|nr:sphinganine-1-phosphate aldolase [Aureococcus anophagefferens]
MEAECVAMVLDMVRGGESACGLLTSGGTESVMIALLAYRERARRADPSRTVFEIVAASTAHACCHKACHYFGLTLVPPDPKTLRLTPAAVAAKLTRHTVAIYASACTFTHGVVDDVPGLAALARARGLGLHVDNCFGGFLLSHLGDRYAGPAWDLSVDGVSSLSCDVHKFGCASKGCSVVAFSDAALRRASYCPRFDGAEGLGDAPRRRGGFEARGLADARDAVVAFVRDRVPELRLLADHDATCPAVVPLGLAPGSPVAPVYAVAHHMAARGWNLPTGQKPACVSVLLAYQHAGPLLDALLADLRRRRRVAAADAKLDGELAVYGAADAIPTSFDGACRLYVDVAWPSAARTSAGRGGPESATRHADRRIRAFCLSAHRPRVLLGMRILRR